MRVGAATADQRCRSAASEVERTGMRSLWERAERTAEAYGEEASAR